MSDTYSVTKQDLKEAGDQGFRVQLRNGETATIIAICPDSMKTLFPIYGFIGNSQQIQRWDKHGYYCILSKDGKHDITGPYIYTPSVGDVFYDPNKIYPDLRIICIEGQYAWVKRDYTYGPSYYTLNINNLIKNYKLKLMENQNESSKIY